MHEDKWAAVEDEASAVLDLARDINAVLSAQSSHSQDLGPQVGNDGANAIRGMSKVGLLDERPPLAPVDLKGVTHLG